MISAGSTPRVGCPSSGDPIIRSRCGACGSSSARSRPPSNATRRLPAVSRCSVTAARSWRSSLRRHQHRRVRQPSRLAPDDQRHRGFPSNRPQSNRPQSDSTQDDDRQHDGAPNDRRATSPRGVAPPELHAPGRRPWSIDYPPPPAASSIAAQLVRRSCDPTTFAGATSRRSPHRRPQGSAASPVPARVTISPPCSACGASVLPHAEHRCRHRFLRRRRSLTAGAATPHADQCGLRRRAEPGPDAAGTNPSQPRRARRRPVTDDDRLVGVRSSRPHRVETERIKRRRGSRPETDDLLRARSGRQRA